MSQDALADKFRKRIETEDELLNSRTTIFLGINGLWAAAAGISGDLPLRIGIGVLGILVSIMWLMCSWQSWKVIKALTKANPKRSNDEVEKTVQRALWSRRYRPTNILAQWLPILFLSVWIIFSSWMTFVSFRLSSRGRSQTLTRLVV